MKIEITEADVRAGLAEHLPLALPRLVDEVTLSVRRAALRRLWRKAGEEARRLQDESTKAAGDVGASDWLQRFDAARRKCARAEKREQELFDALQATYVQVPEVAP